MDTDIHVSSFRYPCSCRGETRDLTSIEAAWHIQGRGRGDQLKQSQRELTATHTYICGWILDTNVHTYICLNVPTLYLCSHLGMWMYRSCTQMYTHQNYYPTVHTSHLWQHSDRYMDRSIIDTNLHTSYLCLNRHTHLRSGWILDRNVPTHALTYTQTHHHTYLYVDGFSSQTYTHGIYANT